MREIVVLYAALRLHRRNRGDDTVVSAILVGFVSFWVGLTLKFLFKKISYLDMCAAVVNVFLLRMPMLQDVVIVSVREDTAWRGLFSLFFVNS